MLRGVLQALNSLSIHVTLTAIVPGAYLGKAKMCKKMCYKKDGYRQRNVRQFLQSAWHIIWLPVPDESHAGMSLPPAVYIAAGGIWLRQESLRHILSSTGYTPGTIAVNFTRIEREFNACQTHRSMYLSIFNRFPVIQPVCLKVRHFSTLLCTFWPPLGTPLGQSR